MATATKSAPSIFNRSDYLIILGSILLIALAAFTHFTHANQVFSFVASAAAIALLASLVGRSVDQLGNRFGPGATGVLQSALGNLPELFIALFALKAGLTEVVQAALIGSILANLLLVLGLAFLTGGLRHGTQKLDSDRAKAIIVLMVLSVAALILPSLASYIHAPASEHEAPLSTIVALILLLLFILTLPASLKKGATDLSKGHAGQEEAARWPLPLAIGILAVSAVGAAFVSDWFVHALEPAMQAFNISEAFAGLVIVAIAGNAVENVVGIQLALKNKSRYAFEVVINSPLQIALVLAPLLVLLSEILGYKPFTLVFSPMLVVSVAVAVIISAFVTFDGESNWIEGAALIAVYAIIAASFWWG